MGLSSVVEIGAFHLASPVAEIRRAVGQFQVDIENASRDLQARIRKTTRKYSRAAGIRTEIKDAMEALQLGEPIAKLTSSAVKKQFANFVRLYHPDAGGTSEGFIHCMHARDTLLRFLETAEKP